MIYNRKSRRMFLRTAGASFIAAPLLPSLFPRGAWSATTPLRYVQLLNNFGNHRRSDLVPEIAGQSPKTVPGTDDCRYLETNTPQAQALLKAQPVSATFTPEVLPYINFIRGLNVFKTNHQHNASLATTASFPNANNSDHAAEIASHPFPSIDWLVENSKIYDAGFQGPRAARVLLAQNYQERWYGSWSFGWNPATKKTFRIETSRTIQAAWNSTFGRYTNAGSGGMIPADPNAALHRKVTDAVLEDYKRVSTHRRLSVDDKNRLNQFMDLMNTVEAPGAVLAANCTKPAVPAEDPNWRLRHQKAIDLMVAALACDLTRVISYQIFQGGDGLGYSYSTMHPWSHGKPCETCPVGGTTADPFRRMTTWRAGLANYFLRKLIEVKDPVGRPLLDSTLFYWGNEFASAGDYSMNEGADLPVVIGGGANGKLRTGLILDYVTRPYNNLLATLMYALGLTAADFEVHGQPGFGIYRRLTRSGAVYSFAPQTFDKYNDTAKRREALPMLLK
jgi:hypothetical protein